MILFYTLFAGLFSPIQSLNTFASVNFTVNCNHSDMFHLEVYLLELDNVPATHDVISYFGVNVIRSYEGTIGGVDTWDGTWNYYYEFALALQHSCGGNWKFENYRELKGECKVGQARCDFPHEVFNLRVG